MTCVTNIILSVMGWICFDQCNLKNFKQVTVVWSAYLFEFILINSELIFRGEAPKQRGGGQGSAPTSGVQGAAAPCGVKGAASQVQVVLLLVFCCLKSIYRFLKAVCIALKTIFRFLKAVCIFKSTTFFLFLHLLLVFFISNFFGSNIALTKIFQF